ncbi:unnamed protein product [Adineta ricciae]|uniref:Uncharacterized protein n=1 Tax=Adineta ricciae TaxID=249248 RepID=A0A816HMC1_ADIRI|nr:unnamed protein product [Adineta ricciae]
MIDEDTVDLFPGRTIRPGTDLFQNLPGISWKQYFGDWILSSDLKGFIENQQEPAITDSRIRLPVPLVGLRVFSRGFQRGKYEYPAGFRRKLAEYCFQERSSWVKLRKT